MVGREFRQRVLYNFKVVYEYKSARSYHADKIAHLLEVDIRELLVSGRPTLKDSDFTSGSK